MRQPPALNNRIQHIWTIPEPLSIQEVQVHDGSILLRQHGNPSGHRLLLSHGNSLAVDFYYPFWSLLEGEFELLVFDLRNHGWNRRSSLENHNMTSLIMDLDEVMVATREHYGEKPVVGVFHSLSCLIALMRSSSLIAGSFDLKGGNFDGLLLFDPPLHRPGFDTTEWDDATDQLAKRTRNRMEAFKTMKEYVELIQFFGSFSHLVPAARELLAETTLLEMSNGTLELVCPAAYESQIVEYIRSYAGQVDLNQLPCPTRVVGADPTLQFAYLPTVDLSEMMVVDYDFVPDASHYLLVEKPDLCAEFVREFVRSLQINPSD